MGVGKKNHSGATDIPNGRITDHFASETRRIILGISRAEGLTAVVFVAMLFAMVLVGVETDGWFYSLAFGVLALAFYSVYSKRQLERERLELLRIQNEIRRGGQAQIRLPLDNATSSGYSTATSVPLPENVDAVIGTESGVN